MTRHRFSLAWRLLGGLLATTLLLVLVGISAIVGNSMQRDALEDVHRVHLASTVQLATANDRLWRLRYGFPQYLAMTGSEDRQRIVQEEPQLDAEIRQILADYGQLPLPANERALLGTLLTAYTRYMEARPHWFELVSQGEMGEAAEHRARTTTPYGRETVTLFGQLLQLQRDNTQAEIQHLIDRANAGRTLTILLLVLSLCILLPVAWVMVQTLRSLRVVQAMARDAAIHIFKEPVVVEGRDEVATLTATIRMTSDRFVRHTQELETAREQLALQHVDMEDQVNERTQELHNTLLNAEQQARQDAALAELNDRLQSCKNQKEAGQVIDAFAPGLFPETPGRIALINASRNLVEPFVAWGTHQPGHETLFDLDACWALRRGDVHASQAGLQDIRCTHISSADSLCIPFHNQDGALGVLTLETAHTPLPRAELERLSMRFSNQVALALTNLRLREKLREQSIIDTLTHLYNRRYFEETLSRELARATRQEAPLALLVLDVDHFKRFNDTHGHEAGDRVLSLVGKAIKTNTRATDIGCRYGGEEFVVVMPDTSLEAAVARANELRLLINEQAADYQQGQYGAVTISCGVATYPVHGQNEAELFAKADKALYSAKHRGRNRVETAEMPPTPEK